jgi:hypothetical protein
VPSLSGTTPVPEGHYPHAKIAANDVVWCRGWHCCFQS